jgi:hypothetical protein
MTDSLWNVVIPYARFLEYQERRRRIEAESPQRDRPAAIDEVPPAAADPTSTPTLNGKQC